MTISPWSIKARWALDWHDVNYCWREYVTVLTPLLLHRRLKVPVSKVTAPVLINGSQALMNALDIVRYADKTGANEPLLHAAEREEIERWDEISRLLSEAGRALMMTRMLTDRAGQMAALPPGLPAAIRGPMSFMARNTAKHLSQKYGFRFEDGERHQATVLRCLELVRCQLNAKASSGLTSLLSRFSYADVSVSSALQLVLPVSPRFVPIHPDTASLWTLRDAARLFPDVLAWRDQIFDAHWRINHAPGACARGSNKHMNEGGFV
ncbi:MAG: glutathione S-transferase N-terminal domain-containing protein [Gammaproteobacteria bacterium]|nr:glutathione S-transferase N-terminal domain-containing protein [Gammaproteobacteria bacterium]